MPQKNKKSIIKSTDSLFIYKFMPKELKLKGVDLLIYAIIYQFHNKKSKEFICQLDYLKQWTGCTKNGILNSLDNLERKSFIKQEKYKDISDEEYFNKFNKKFKNGCLFCGINDIPLQKHHYPIRKKDDGKDTINLCPNCHIRFHTKQDYFKKLTILNWGQK